MKTVLIILVVALVAVTSADDIQGAYKQDAGVGHGQGVGEGKNYLEPFLIGRYGFGFDRRSLRSSGLMKPITIESLQPYILPIREDYQHFY